MRTWTLMDTAHATMAGMEITVTRIKRSLITAITSITDSRPLILTTTMDTLETITTTEDTSEIVIQPAMVA